MASRIVRRSWPRPRPTIRGAGGGWTDERVEALNAATNTLASGRKPGDFAACNTKKVQEFSRAGSRRHAGVS